MIVSRWYSIILLIIYTLPITLICPGSRCTRLQNWWCFPVLLMMCIKILLWHNWNLPFNLLWTCVHCWLFTLWHWPIPLLWCFPSYWLSSSEFMPSDGACVEPFPAEACKTANLAVDVASWVFNSSCSFLLLICFLCYSSACIYYKAAIRATRAALSAATLIFAEEVVLDLLLESLLFECLPTLETLSFRFTSS